MLHKGPYTGCLDRGSASFARCRSSPSHAAVTGRHRPTARPRRLQRAVATRRIPQRRTRRVREEGGSTGSTAHDSVTVAVLGLLLHVDAVGAGGEVRLVLRREPRRGGTTKQLLLETP